MSPKIRKKDPCPCGSGKRYKDCCFKKKKYSKDTSQEVSKEPTTEELKKIFKDKDFVENLAELVRDLQTGEGLEKYPGLRWSSKKVAKMSTEEIIEKLESMNVHFDEEEFKEQAQSYLSAVHLAEDQYYTQDWRGALDEDFIWLAICELWNRLIPEQVNTEMIEDALLDGYDDLEYGDYTGALGEWEAAWNMIKKIVPPEITSVEKADEFIDSVPYTSLAQSLFNWCQDFEEVLLDQGLDEKSYLEKRITFAAEFCQQFPNTDDTIIQKMLKAEAHSYALLGDIEKAEKLFDALTKKFPECVWGYIWWGDIYVDMTPPDSDKAEAMYRLGLAHCTRETEEIYDRLKELEEEYSCS